MSKGHAWAAIAAMILWTVEKILPMAVFSHSYIASAIFWHIYMRSFYLAYHVEQERKKIIPEEISPRTFKSPPVQVIQ